MDNYVFSDLVEMYWPGIHWLDLTHEQLREMWWETCDGT